MKFLKEEKKWGIPYAFSCCWNTRASFFIISECCLKHFDTYRIIFVGRVAQSV